MSRKTDLESHIRESSDLISQYETLMRLSSDPREKARARRAIEEQRELLRGHLAEYRRLCRASGQNMASDIAEIAAGFDLAIEEQGRADQSVDATLPSIGIITALPKEQVAVEAMLDQIRDHFVDGQRYVLGSVPAVNGVHHVVLTRTISMGNNPAGVHVALLLGEFPNVESIVMVGIAGGVPNPDKPEQDMQLGDVVVSNEQGVIQYDNTKDEAEKVIVRHPPRSPGARLLDAVRRLEEDDIKGRRRWPDYIDRATHLRDALRPDGTAQRPRAFLAPIGSANVLLKNIVRRDRLYREYGIRAVEMEGSGVADAIWIMRKDYLVVRGICDFADQAKNDRWQGYAAVAAAAYTRGLLEKLPS